MHMCICLKKFSGSLQKKLLTAITSEEMSWTGWEEGFSISIYPFHIAWIFKTHNRALCLTAFKFGLVTTLWSWTLISGLKQLMYCETSGGRFQDLH